MIFLESVLFLISSAITFAIIYYKIPINFVNVILVVLMMLGIYISTRLNSPNINPLTKKINLDLIVLASSLFTQIFVISSGGFYSPFLILIYLYSITSSFLLNLSSSVTFLISSFILLVINTTLNPAIFAKFKEDPFTLILYVISFIIVIPLAQAVNKTYHLKEKASEKLKNLVDIGISREESILRSLEEMVVVTDLNLTVLSANGAFEKNMKMVPGAYLNKQVFEVLDLKDSFGNKATRDTLYIDRVLRDKATRIIEGLFLKTKLKPQGIKINIHLRPIKDSQDNITQIVFILTDKNLTKATAIHEDLAKLRTSNQLLYNQIKESLIKANIPNLEFQLELFSKHQEDLNIAQELEDHPIKDFKSFKDLALLSKEILNLRKTFADKFSVPLIFNLPESESSEQAAIKMVETKSPFTENIIPDFGIPMDTKWVTILLEHLIDLCIYLNSDQKNRNVTLFIHRVDHIIKINLITTCKNIGIDYQVLFKPYYNHLLTQTNLKYSSGLEGYIAKSIATQLEKPIEVEYLPLNSKLTLTISFTK